METKTKIKNLAEDSYRLSISDFGKKLLWPTNSNRLDNFDLLYNKENNLLKGKQGHFAIQSGIEKLHIFFNVDQNRSPKVLNIRFNKKEGGFDGTTQKIVLEEDVAKFGIRPFFQCQCGKCATVLYMIPGQKIFCCRICGNITYNSQRQNKKTMAGLFHHTNKLLKLVKMEEKTPRAFYAGKFTKKKQKLMERYKMWHIGVTEEMKKSAIYIKNIS